MSASRAMFSHFIREDLEGLSKSLDQCFETINMFILWQAMNNVHDEDKLMREEVVSFFSKDFGNQAGELLADLLLGPPEATQDES